MFLNITAMVIRAISPPCFLAECNKRQLNQASFVFLYFTVFVIFSSIQFEYFPVAFCLSVSVKWLAVKTASEITYTVSQKTSKIIFVITMSNFHQIWQFLAQRWRIVQNYMRCTHFPPHLIHVNALPC